MKRALTERSQPVLRAHEDQVLVQQSLRVLDGGRAGEEGTTVNEHEHGQLGAAINLRRGAKIKKKEPACFSLVSLCSSTAHNVVQLGHTQG